MTDQERARDRAVNAIMLMMAASEPDRRDAEALVDDLILAAQPGLSDHARAVEEERHGGKT